jgi:mRNA interferase MazF
VVSIRRGEVYFVYLDPVVGHEQGGRRPVVVLSINRINDKPLVVTVVPGTTARDDLKAYRNIVRIEHTAVNGLSAPTVFLCHQLRSLDRSRFSGGAAGSLSGQDIYRIEKSVKYTLGILW